MLSFISFFFWWLYLSFCMLNSQFFTLRNSTKKTNNNTEIRRLLFLHEYDLWHGNDHSKNVHKCFLSVSKHDTMGYGTTNNGIYKVSSIFIFDVGPWPWPLISESYSKPANLQSRSLAVFNFSQILHNECEHISFTNREFISILSESTRIE